MTSAADRRTARLLDRLAIAVEAHRDPDGTPVRDIAAEAGVGTMVVQRFLAGQGSIALRSFVALARWAGYDAVIRHAHKECIREVLGPPEHLDGRCSCNDPQAAPSGRTYRQEALDVWERLAGTAQAP